jgi:lysozyme
MTEINPLVVDLSHWEPADDYDAIVEDGIAGVIYKATEGRDYTDDTCVYQQRAAKDAGLVWGSYHFADGSDVDGQVANFLRFACPDPDDLFCLDWEDNGGDTMSLEQAQEWITKVEAALNRPGECVLYSGNTAKEALGDTVNEFFGSRRLWLCQYSGSTPICQASWSKSWLWQFTDGISGPEPHTIHGIGRCDINSFDGTDVQLIAEWASGRPRPTPPLLDMVDLLVTAPARVIVKVR